MFLPSSLWGIKLPRRRLGASSMIYIYIYILKRLPDLPPCGSKRIEKATRDILSSLRSCLQRRGGTAELEEDQRGATVAILWPSHQTKPNSQTQGREDSHVKALQEAREADQWALNAAHVLELNTERLSRKANSANC